MTPFLLAELPEMTIQQAQGIARSIGIGVEQVVAEFVEMRAVEKVWLNDTYQVNERTVPTPAGIMKWLSIKRIDRETIHDWRDLQEIKNMLVGPENEGVELYPAESRRVDSANQYHLFVFAHPG